MVFALTFVTPTIRIFFESTEIFNAASGCIVVGIMILPMVASLCDDALNRFKRFKARWLCSWYNIL